MGSSGRSQKRACKPKSVGEIATEIMEKASASKSRKGRPPGIFNPDKHKCWLTGYGMGEPNRSAKRVRYE